MFTLSFEYFDLTNKAFVVGYRQKSKSLLDPSNNFLPIDCKDFWTKYRKVVSSNTFCLEAHAGFFQIAYEGDFRSLCTVTYWQKVDSLISNAR